MRHVGWILDLYPKNGRMTIWLKPRNGKCVKLVDDWKPTVHVASDLTDLIDLAAQPFMPPSTFTEKFVRAGDSEKRKVLGIEVKSEVQAVSLARRIQRYGNHSKFRLYDVDVPFTQRYLYQKELFPLAFVEADYTSENVQWTLKDSRETLDYDLPNFKTIRIQIQTKKKTGNLPGYDDELGFVKILCDNETFQIESGDESEKICGLVDAFSDVDPDVVLTDGGDSFIFPYLANRAQSLRIDDKLILGREKTSLKIYEAHGHSYFSYGKILYRETAARLFGRLHIDEANAFFVNDCGLDGLFEVARTCIIPIQRASRTTIGTSMTSLQLYHAIKSNILIPWNKNEPEEFKDGNEIVTADRGGFIFEPKVGIHEDVGELDFSSLYPTLMLRKNLSGETVNCECCSTSNMIPELGFNVCEKWTGIVPRSLAILLRKRAQYKKFRKTALDPPKRLRYDQRQAALKWILVCS